MIQFPVALEELATILQRHFQVQGAAKVDFSVNLRAGRISEPEGPEIPTIIVQVTGVILSVEDEIRPGVRGQQRKRRAPRRGSARSPSL